MSVVMSLLLLIGGVTSTEAPKGFIQEGKASYYAQKFTGRRTTCGERVSAVALTGAHRSLPFNTLVEVTNLRNHRSVIVRINDRGPYAKGRIIDITHAAAKAIGMISAGVAAVSIRIVSNNYQLAAAPTQPVGTDAVPLLPDLD